MKNNRFKIGVGSVGNLQSSNLKTLLSNPSGFGNYTLVQAEFITERMIHLYAITLGVTPPIQVDGYITYNNVELSWSGWKSYVTNSNLYNMFTIGDTTTFSAVLSESDRLNKITPFVFYYPSDNPFSFSMGYGIAFNARLLHNNKMFTIMAFDKTGTQIEVKQFTIT